MNNGVIDLTDRIRANGHAPNGKAPPRGRGPVLMPHLYEWDANVSAMLRLDDGAVPNIAACHYHVYLDPRRPAYRVSIMREGWDYPLVLADAYVPGESIERTWARRGALWLINQSLAAAYRVPA